MLVNSRLALILLINVALVAARQPAAAQSVSNAPAKAAPQIVLLTIEGTVEVAPAGTLNWAPARTNQVLNVGDRVHTAEGSRATILLTDRSVQRVGDLTTLEIRPPTQPGRRLLLDLKAGKSYLFNREKPTELQFRTPLASGAIRGTEFELSVDAASGRTVLTLIEGEVELSNAQGEVTLASGYQGIVEPGQAPRKAPALDTLNVIQWTLYYPAVLVVAELLMDVADQQALADSLAAYRVGDSVGALNRYPAGRQPATDAERTYRAALLLAAGDVPRAETLLDGVTGNSRPAGALRKLIAAVKGRSIASVPPTTASEDLAESYYQQSQSQLPEALLAARHATAWAPGFGPAWIRVAELEMSFGRMQTALAALDRGLELAPRHAQGFALRGFALAQQGDTRQAERWFNDAIAIDPALANAWLGRGLCKHRHGDTAGGREDLQVAAALEPNRSLLRSYLGKSWTAEGHFRNAEKELRLAQQFDPNDPTSWLYLALLQQQENRINEAVANLEQSKALNGNRSLFQSRFGLEQDLATRSANLAGIYRDAGLFEWSTREASRAVNADYGNFSAHLFLASSYDALRDPKLINLRYETPWLSEQLVANLLAPAAAGAFPLNISEEPYSRLFQGDHVGIVSSTEYFSSGAWNERGSEYGILGKSSFSIDAYYQRDPGQRPNNDLDQTALSATFKQQLTEKDSLFLRAEDFRSESGDLAQYYDQNSANLAQRVHERQDPNAYIGWHREWAPGSHTLFLAGYLEDNLDFNGSFNLTTFIRPAGTIVDAFLTRHGVSYETDFHALSGELQQIWQNDRHTFIFGGRFQGGRVETHSTVTNDQFLPPTLHRQDFDNDLARASAYGYWFWQITRPLQLQAGVSYDYLDFPENAVVPPISDDQQHRDQVSPELGFHYAPWTNTTLRGAWTRSLGGVYFDTSVRLEPTQVGGFNQAFRSVAPESVVGLVPGTRFETVGVALEQKFSTRTYLTLAGELLYSDADRMIGAFNFSAAGTAPTSIKQNINFRERTLAATVNQLLGDNWSLGANYRLTDADLDSQFPAYESIPRLSSLASTHEAALLNQVTLFANYYCRCGFFAQGWSIWSQQHNEGALPDSDFWQHNVAIGYRFPRRHAELRVSLLNILDEDYRLNPLTLYNELPRERTLAVGFKFYF
jgi:tetratricopeptide (TPR) repeat protein